MKNYKYSDYALNKYSENIVYRFQNERIEISLKDYLSENPDKTEEDFKELKMLSDEMFHEQVKKDYNQTRLNSPLEYFENIVENSNCLLEDEYIEKLDKYYSKKALKALESWHIFKVEDFKNI